MTGRDDPRAAGPTRTTSGPLTAIAISLPIMVLTLSCGTFIALSDGMLSLGETVRESGWTAYAVGAMCVVSLLGTSVMLFFSARGARLPSFLVVGMAALPWLTGIAGARHGMGIVQRALTFADRANVASLLAQGIAECLCSWILGAFFGGALLASVALGLGVAAIGQQAPERKWLLALPGLLLAFAAVGVASLVNQARTSMTLMIALPIFATGIALGLAGAAAGKDEPRGRSRALAAAAGLAGLLSILAIATTAELESVRYAFSAIASAEGSQHMLVLLEGAAEATSAYHAGVFACIPVGLGALIVTAWAVSRGKPTAGQAVGALAILCVAVAFVGIDRGALAAIGSDFREAVRPEWSNVPDFRPMAVPGRHTQFTVDAVFAPTFGMAIGGARVPIHGTSAQVAEPAIASVLRASVSSPRHLQGSAVGPREGGPTHASVALAQGSPTWLLRAIVSAADAQHISELEIAGRANDEPETGVERASSFVRPFFGAPHGVWVELPSSIAAARPAPDPGDVLARLEPPGPFTEGPPDTDPVLWHTSLDAHTTDVVINPRPLSEQSAQTLTADFIRDGTPASYGSTDSAFAAHRVYVAFSDDARIEHVLAVVDAIRARGGRPVLCPAGIPGNPDHPLEHETGSGDLGGLSNLIVGLGNVGAFGTDTNGGGGTGEGFLGLGDSRAGHDSPLTHYTGPVVRTGSSSVHGSLPRELIQRIIHQNLAREQFCYEQRLVQEPGLAGVVEVSFIIDQNGSVQSAMLSKPPFDAQVGACVAQAVRALVFPAPEGGGIVAVIYPFRFSPTS